MVTQTKTHFAASLNHHNITYYAPKPPHSWWGYPYPPRGSRTPVDESRLSAATLTNKPAENIPVGHLCHLPSVDISSMWGHVYQLRRVAPPSATDAQHELWSVCICWSFTFSQLVLMRVNERSWLHTWRHCARLHCSLWWTGCWTNILGLVGWKSAKSELVPNPSVQLPRDSQAVSWPVTWWQCGPKWPHVNFLLLVPSQTRLKAHLLHSLPFYFDYSIPKWQAVSPGTMF